MAASSDLWVACDGQQKPGSAQALGTRLARSGLLVAPGSIPPQQASGVAAIAACTEVLTDRSLARSWQRRISVLHARAANYADLGDFEAAGDDLVAARQAAAAGAPDGWFARSSGLSSQLLEAALLAKQGKTSEAEALAIAASDARPYSIGVAGAASRILRVDTGWSEDKDRVLTRLAALDPEGLSARAWARGWASNPDLAAQDWFAVDALAEAQRMERAQRLAKVPEAARMMSPPPNREVWVNAAYALVRAGRTEEARAFAARLSEPDRLADAQPGQIFVDYGFERTKHHAALINAAIAAREGRLEEARALVGDQRAFHVSLVSIDLVRRLKEAGFEGFAGLTVDEAGTRAVVREENASNLKLVELLRYLPPAESGGGANVYDGRSAFDLDTTGFKDFPDGNGRHIEFAGGDATSGAVGEMMLMRAAELARASGKPGFLIVSRIDGARQRTTYSASGKSVTPLGFQTEATVIFVDPAALPPLYASHPERVYLADKVWADLAPFYLKK